MKHSKVLKAVTLTASDVSKLFSREQVKKAGLEGSAYGFEFETLGAAANYCSEILEDGHNYLFYVTENNSYVSARFNGGKNLGEKRLVQLLSLWVIDNKKTNEIVKSKHLKAVSPAFAYLSLVDSLATLSDLDTRDLKRSRSVLETIRRSIDNKELTDLYNRIDREINRRKG